MKPKQERAASPWPWLAMLTIAGGWLWLFLRTDPAIPAPPAPTEQPSPSTAPSGPTGSAVWQHVIPTTETPTPTRVVTPLATYTRMPVCWPGAGTATPVRGQTCYQPANPIVPATARPSPTCGPIATPATLCVWEG